MIHVAQSLEFNSQDNRHSPITLHSKDFLSVCEKSYLLVSEIHFHINAQWLHNVWNIAIRDTVQYLSGNFVLCSTFFLQYSKIEKHL